MKRFNLNEGTIFTLEEHEKKGNIKIVSVLHWLLEK